MASSSSDDSSVSTIEILIYLAFYVVVGIIVAFPYKNKTQNGMTACVLCVACGIFPLISYFLVIKTEAEEREEIVILKQERINEKSTPSADLQLNVAPPPPTPSVPVKPKITHCSYTGKKYSVQETWECTFCDIEICAGCAKHCHNSHMSLKNLGMTEMYCDCGDRDHKGLISSSI